MDPNTINQAINLIDKSQNILLLTHAKADCDGLGAMLSAYLVLKDLGKDITAVTNDPTPENLEFLPAISIVQNSLASVKDFIISLDITRTPLSKIKYNLEGNFVNIIVTPKNGTFSKEDVSFSQGTNKFDLIIAMDAGNLEHLGPIYDKNSELFFETPIINIDHHASNTDFGQINMVDIVAASATEILYYVLRAMEKKYNKKLITKDVATLLLAGIITDTGSFQHANTSPKSMEVSAKLLDLGARQQDIIKNIYKTKKLSTLKLWGVVLSKVQVDPVHRIVWSTIAKEDIQETDADPDESEGIIDDLLSNAPGAEVIMLIKQNEKEGYTSVSMRSTTNAVDVGKIATEMGGGGHVRAAGYKIRDGRAFDQIVSEILAKVREYQSKRLNISPEDVETPLSGASQDEGVPKKPPKPQQNQAEGSPLGREATQQKEKKSTYLEFKAPKLVEPAKPVPPVPSGAEVTDKPETKSGEEKREQPKPKRRKRPPRRRKSEFKKPEPARPTGGEKPQAEQKPKLPSGPQQGQAEGSPLGREAGSQPEIPPPPTEEAPPAPQPEPPHLAGEPTLEPPPEK